MSQVGDRSAARRNRDTRGSWSCDGARLHGGLPVRPGARSPDTVRLGGRDSQPGASMTANAPLRGREPFGAGVPAGGEPAQGQVGLRREDQGEQPGAQAEVAVREPDPDRDGDHRDRHGRDQLEDQRGEERDLERRERALAVGLADARDRGELRSPAAEDLQRRQAAHDVEEVAGEALEARQLALYALAGDRADERHEDRDQRQREQHDQSRDPVVGEDRDRRSPRARSRRAADGGGRARSSRRARRCRGRRGSRASPVPTLHVAARRELGSARQERAAELRLRLRARAHGAQLRPPGERAARERNREQGDESRAAAARRRGGRRTPRRRDRRSARPAR